MAKGNIFDLAEDEELRRVSKLKDSQPWAADRYIDIQNKRGHSFDKSEFSSDVMQKAIKRRAQAKPGTFKRGGTVQKTGMAKVHKGEKVLTKSEAGRMKAHIKGMKERGQFKVGKVMHEFKHGELHSGSKSGPVVTSRKQAVAIAMSEKRKAQKGAY